MTPQSSTEESNVSLGNLGIVAAAFDSLGISELIDMLLPKTRPHKLSHGDIVKAMVLNGLGFVERRLYFYCDYFLDLPRSRLFGKDLSATDFTDDVLGRTLDAIAEYGPTELFNEVLVKCLPRSDYVTRCIHIDTTTFNVSGEYASDSDSCDVFITYGHSKDGRRDLKQFILGMATDQCGIPLFLETFAGNESDKKSILEIMQHLTDNLNNPEKVYHVADAAFYTADNLTTLGAHTFWITRVPVTLKEVKSLVSSDIELNQCTDKRYQYAEYSSKYAGIPQKWVMYQSEMQQKRQERTFQKTLEKEKKAAEISLRKLCAQPFACEEDTRRATEMWLKEHQLFCFSSLEFQMISRKKTKKRGRPTANEEMEEVHSVSAKIEYNEDEVQHRHQKLGRFVLATNDLELKPNELLALYKEQGTVERGFRFLKDPSFRVSEIYLKKPSRIQALAMIMVLCLFIYSVTEFRLRQKLKESGETVTGRDKKQTQKQTLKWVFTLFERVRVNQRRRKEKLKEKVVNMTPELWKILKLMGKEYEKYYL